VGDRREEFTVADWSVHPDLNRISRDGEEVRLEPRVMDLLVYLASHGDEVLSRNRIVDDVWPEAFVGDDALLTAVSALRRAFGDDPRKPEVIETIPKRGYRFIAATSAAAPSIAVLPLRDLAADDETGFFAAAMTDSLVTELGATGRMRTISRHSVMAYAGSDKSIAQIAGELDVRFVVEGSVARSGRRVRITCRVIEAAVDRQVLAESYEGELGNIFDVQREAAQTIAQAISVGVAPERQTRRRRSVDPEALIAYQRGRFHWWRFTPDHFRRALEYFSEAIDRDPGFAAAYAGVADVWGAYAYWGLQRPSEVRDNVRNAIRRAVEIDPDNAEARMMNGAFYFYFERDWEAASKEFRRATELNPSLGHAHVLNALFLGARGRGDAGNEADIAVQLDPLNPGTLLVRALCRAAAGDFDAARNAVDQLLELAPGHPPALLLRADLCWRKRSPGAPQAELDAWNADLDMRQALASGGLLKTPGIALRAAVELLRTRAKQAYVQPMQIARLLVHAEDHEQAVAVLDRAERGDELIQIDFLALSPAWDPLRRRPDFIALQQRIGLRAPGSGN